MKYKCPLCNSVLTESHYHNVIKLKEREEKVQKGELERLQRKAESAKLAIRAAKEKAKRDIATTKRITVEIERKKSEMRNKRLMSKIQKLEKEKKMLKDHTNPQEIGLADEKVLAAKLEKEFPSDKIIHAGKGGDVLQFVSYNGEKIGCIVYECKNTEKISGSHIDQTALAKKSRGADYAILVTTGTRRGFSGLDQESGVFIVAQSGVLTLAAICRGSLIEMAKQKINENEKILTAKNLMDYITSPTCKTPIEEAIGKTEMAQEMLKKEVKNHFKDWQTRHALYLTIHYDISHVQQNISRVIEGKSINKLEKTRVPLLALPAPVRELNSVV